MSNREEIDNLDVLIKSYYKTDKKLNPILDGIIDYDTYSKSFPKILWILKEPYDKSEHGDGGWDSRISIGQKIDDYFKIPTWRRIAFASYGILNNLKYGIKHEGDFSESLKSIAYINVSKYPAETTSQGRDHYLQEVYEKDKGLLHKQIECFKPEIIIGGSTFYHFLKYFGLNWNEGFLLPKMGRTFWKKDSKLFIDAYHPAQLAITEEEYCNEIIETVINLLP